MRWNQFFFCFQRKQKNVFFLHVIRFLSVCLSVHTTCAVLTYKLNSKCVCFFFGIDCFSIYLLFHSVRTPLFAPRQWMQFFDNECLLILFLSGSSNMIIVSVEKHHKQITLRMCLHYKVQANKQSNNDIYTESVRS